MPAELIAVVGGTAVSHILGLGSVYNVRLVGNIPMGLPLPELPPVKLLGLVAFDSIAIAIVSYTVTISMALIFAKKQNYEVDPNQELLAMVRKATGDNSIFSLIHLIWHTYFHKIVFFFVAFCKIGFEQHSWRCLLMCAKCNIFIALIDPGANRWKDANCVCCISIFDFDHFIVDRTILPSTATGKRSISIHARK